MVLRIFFMGIVALVAIFFVNRLVDYFMGNKLKNFVEEDMPVQVSEKKVLAVAMKSGGKVTLPEVCLKTNLSIDKAKETLDSLMNKNIMTIQMTESGSTVYSVIDLLSQEEKDQAIDLV